MTFTPIPMPEIETERLVLRGWRAEDFDCVAALFGDEDNARYIGGVKPDWQAWRHMAMIYGHWHLRGFMPFVVQPKNADDAIGYVGPWYPYGWPEPEIGYALVPGSHGKGYATEASIASLAYAYQHMGWSTTMSLIDAKNEGSKNVARKMGAVFEREETLFGEFEAELWRHLPADQFLERHS